MTEKKSDNLLSSPNQWFSVFSTPMIGLSVSHVWRGSGSALFLEFGVLHPKLRPDGSIMCRRDGSPMNPQGEWTLQIEWGWRIEGPRSVICGSWSDERRWPRAFHLLKNKRVERVSLFGKLPEVELCLSNRLNVLSFNTSDGDPAWSLVNKREGNWQQMFVRRGVVSNAWGDKE